MNNGATITSGDDEIIQRTKSLTTTNGSAATNVTLGTNSVLFARIRALVIICFVGTSIYVSHQAIPIQGTKYDDRYEPYLHLQEQHDVESQSPHLRDSTNKIDNNINNNNEIQQSRQTTQQKQEQQPSLGTSFDTTTATADREEYYKSMNDGLPIGILSKQPISFFRNLQKEIDDEDNTIRCKRYGAYYNSSNPRNRRIFYGALIASEPWEVFEIVSAETYGIYSAMVYVEGNRTQNFTPRKFLRSDPENLPRYIAAMQQLFNVSKIQIRQFVQEDRKLQDLNREHYQRAEIIKGWKELGMTVDDVGFIADTDETFTRDFLRAVQVCDGFEILDYEKHHCHHNLVKMTATTKVFESTPECITQGREWFHPDMIIGHCIEGINTGGHHPAAPRDTSELYPFIRRSGYGGNCGDWGLDNNKDLNHTLWNAADFRRACGGYMHHIKKKDATKRLPDQTMVQLDRFTGFHFHNFFSQFKSTRFKYLTYGHPDPNVNMKPIYNMSNDLNMMYQCIKNNTPVQNQFWKHIIGNYNALKPFHPIYFQDPDYRERRHNHVKQMVQEDEELLKERLQNFENEKGAQKQKNNAQHNNNQQRQQQQQQQKPNTYPVHINYDDDSVMDREGYYQNFNDGLSIGILSKETTKFFRKLQRTIDDADHVARCERYGGYYNTANPQNRRIFYGALAASEPWEVFEIVSAETYGVYSGMVFVEGNRTQNFTPRKFQRLHHSETMKLIFGSPQVQIRSFVQEDPLLLDLGREHAQRAEILVGWKELGMQPNDIGLLADSDETFTRDFLRAVQVCDGIDVLNYEQHKCHHSLVKLTGKTRVFESTAECVADGRSWFHPDMIIGHCIEGISDKPNVHEKAPRKGNRYPFERENGYGGNCKDWENDDANKTGYTLWNAADFRRTCGGYMKNTKPNQYFDGKLIDVYTGFHFHNFFAQFKSTRFKYLTYGHPDPNVTMKPIYNMSNDLQMMYNCVMNKTVTQDQKWKHVAGGFNAVQPFYPIYFQDSNYRQSRHHHVINMIEEDEQLLQERLLNQQLLGKGANASATASSNN